MSEDRSLKNKFFGKVAPYVLAGLTAIVPFSSATAQDQVAAVPEGSSTKVSLPAKQREAWMEASDYSVEHPGVAFAVYGRAPNATNQQIVGHVKEQLAQKGVTNITSFTSMEDTQGVAFHFFLGGHAYGPVGIPKMNETIDEVAGHSLGIEAEQKTQIEKTTQLTSGPDTPTQQ